MRYFNKDRTDTNIGMSLNIHQLGGLRGKLQLQMASSKLKYAH